MEGNKVYVDVTASLVRKGAYSEKLSLDGW